jgi:hypothetical protein
MPSEPVIEVMTASTDWPAIAAGITTGVVGLAGIAATFFQNKAAQKERRTSEDKARWLQERLHINSQFLSAAVSLERDIWDVAAQLDRDSRDERMPGYTTILLTPEEGLPGVFDEVTRAILVEAIEDAFSKLDSMNILEAQIALIGTSEEAETAKALNDALLDAVGRLEIYAPFDEAAEAVLAVKDMREQFAKAARSSLRVEGPSTPSNKRSRRDAGSHQESDVQGADEQDADKGIS